jgi:hypothetical protein
MPATALEQMLLELINRARLDPAAEAARFGIALNEGLAPNTISGASKQPLAMNETLLSVARAHSQDMINRDYFGHDTPEGVTPFQRIANAGYSAIAAGENIALRTSGVITNPLVLLQHQDLFVDSGIPGRGHRLNILDPTFQEIGGGQVTGNYQGSNATMLTQDFATASSRQFLTGVSYADVDLDRFYSIGEGRNGMTIAIGGSSTATAGAGGYSLQVGTGVQNVAFSGGGLSAPISLAVTVLANTNAKVDVVDQNVVYTSASLTDLGGAATIIGLGTIGLSLTGDGGNDTIFGTKGNDTLNGGNGADTAAFSGARSAYTITQITGGFQIAGLDGSDQLFNIESAQFADQTISLSGPPTPQPSHPHWMASTDIGTHPPGYQISGIGDFNNEGTSDVLWFNPTTRDTDIWSLNNGKWAASSTIGLHPAGYQISGIGDFNKDGTSDVLWYNPMTRDTDIWLLNNGKWAASSTIGLHPAGYDIAGIGDFNNDGTSDVLWFNPATHDTDIWTVINGKWAASTTIGLHPPGYDIAGIGDFNNDGTSDVLWVNPTTNETDVWTLNNGHWAGSTTIGSHPAGYQVAGVDDFNKDGTDDVVWYNPSNNDVDVWLVQNGQWAGSASLGAHPPGSAFVGVGDFDHNGVADIMWRDANTGNVETWLIAFP